jgi:hypothetical protein
VGRRGALAGARPRRVHARVERLRAAAEHLDHEAAAISATSTSVSAPHTAAPPRANPADVPFISASASRPSSDRRESGACQRGGRVAGVRLEHGALACEARATCAAPPDPLAPTGRFPAPPARRRR